MQRNAVGLAALTVLCAVLPGAPRAELVWLRAAPVVAGTRGLTAVASDPQDPQLVWVAGAGRVLVSDDAGESWQVVLDLGRSVARDPDEDDDDEDGDDEAEQDEGGGLEDGEGADDVEDESEDPRSREDAAPEDDGALPPGDEEAASAEEIEQLIGSRIVRLRVLADRVWVCWGRGLWWVPREARALGQAQELRYGRRSAVLDVAAAGAQGLWIASARGLLVGDRDGLASPVGGSLGNLPVRALTKRPQGLLVAAEDGLAVGGRDGFAPLGLALGRRPVEDLAGWSIDGILAASRLEVHRVTWAVGGAPQVDASWRVPDARRVGVTREGAAWLVGSAGAWRLGTDGWSPAFDGIADGRLADLAPVLPGSSTRLWAVGRGGAWRLVPEEERVRVVRARESVPAEEAGAEVVLRWAEEARQVALAQQGDLRAEQAAAPALPKVEVEYRRFLWRDEALVWSDLLEGYLLDDVSVAPGDEDFRFILWWDLAPVLWPPGAAGSAVETEEIRRALGREDVRKTVLPAFQAWRVANAEARQGAHRDVVAALRAELERQRLEADLAVYTEGRFRATLAPSGPSGEAP